MGVNAERFKQHAANLNALIGDLQAYPSDAKNFQELKSLAATLQVALIHATYERDYPPSVQARIDHHLTRSKETK